MKKSLVPLIILLIIGGIITYATIPNTPAATKKLFAAIEQAADSNKTVFLQLSSTGCVTCRKMKPEVEKVIADYKGNDNIAIINIDVDAHPVIASQFGVTVVPTQVVISSGFRELFRNVGYLSYDNMKDVITKAVNLK